MKVREAGVSGGRVTLITQFARLTLSLCVLAILGRLLPPSDFGLVAMATAFVGLGDIVRDLGLAAAAVQARTISQAQKSNLFWINSVAGLTFSIACITAAPLIAAVFGDQRLVPVVCALAGVYFLNGLQTQSQAELSRSLRFTSLAVSDLSAYAAGAAVAISLAVFGAGYWALVAQLLAQSVILCVLRVVVAGWLPSAPTRGPMGALLSFGVYSTLVQVIAYLGNNAHNVLIGRALGPAALGFYSRAFQLYMVPTIQVLGPLTGVAHSTMSRLQDSPERMAAALRRLASLLGYPIALLCTVMVVAPDETVRVLLGPGWDEAGPVLGALSVGGAILGLNRVGVWTYQALGLTKPLFLTFALTRTMIIAAMLIALPHGLTWIAIAYSATIIASWPINMIGLHRRHLIPREYWFVSFRVLAVSLTAGLAASGALMALPEGIDALARLSTAVVTVLAGAALGFLVAPVRRDYIAGIRAVVARS